MKKIHMILAGAMALYFVLAVLVSPPIYSNAEVKVPKPRIEVTLSSDGITLGQSFDVTIKSYNEGDTADMQLVSVAFPHSQNLDMVTINSYDFMQSPQLIAIGDEIGSEYTAGAKTVASEYPSIEAYSRPFHQGDTFQMTLKITPKEAGQFQFFTKTVAMPHASEESHYPDSGTLDHQNEFVQIHTVEVTR